MIQSDSLTDVNFDVSDNSSGIFRSVLKRGFVSKLPDAIKDRFNDKSSQARTTSIYTRPLKEKKTKRQLGRKVTPIREDKMGEKWDQTALTREQLRKQWSIVSFLEQKAQRSELI